MRLEAVQKGVGAKLDGHRPSVSSSSACSSPVEGILDGVFDGVQAEQVLSVAMNDSRRRDHLGVQQRVPRDVAHEGSVMAVGPRHHGRNTEGPSLTALWVSVPLHGLHCVPEHSQKRNGFCVSAWLRRCSSQRSAHSRERLG